MYTRIIFILIGICAICAGFLSFLMKVHDNDNDKSSEKVAKLPIIAQQVIDQNNPKVINIATTIENQSINKVSYEDDWCVGALELSVEDFAFSISESKEWKARRGDFGVPQKDIYGNYFDDDASLDIVAYMEMDIDRLLELAYQDDQYALVAAMNRSELKRKKRILIAHRLMILGNTSLAPQFLTIVEMVTAQSQYQKEKKLTPEIKDKIMTALAYVAYGISNYDLSALTAYLQILNRAPFKDNFDLGLILTKEDYQNVGEGVKEIKRQISEFREQENLSYLDDQDLPKIAIHDFQRRLAALYVEHADALAELELLTLDKGPSLKKSVCIERHIKRFEN